MITESPRYCLEPLNKENCSPNGEMVYTYDPVARQCRWEMWSGCDTLNKFPDEDTCQRVCTGVTVENNSTLPVGIKLHGLIENMDKLEQKYLEEMNEIVNDITENEEENSGTNLNTLKNTITSPATKELNKVNDQVVETTNNKTTNTSKSNVVAVSDLNVNTTASKDNSTQTKKIVNASILSDKVDKDKNDDYENFNVEAFQKGNQELQKGTVADVIIPGNET